MVVSGNYCSLRHNEREREREDKKELNNKIKQQHDVIVITIMTS